MQIVCLDLEGVLVPEIWIAFSERTGIAEFRRTTRDEPDYDKLMRFRLGLLRQHGLKLADIQAVIAGMAPMEGAKAFLDDLRSRYQVIILSDTFYEFADPLMAQLGRPTLFCHRLETDAEGFVAAYHLRQPNQKFHAVQALKGLNFQVIAAGDSYNDTGMLGAADAGFFIHPPPGIVAQFPQFPGQPQLRRTARRHRRRRRPPGRLIGPQAPCRARTWNCWPRRVTRPSASKPSTMAPMPSTSAARPLAHATRPATRCPRSKALCRHAHRYGARIFVTLNTILRDDELEAARAAWPGTYGTPAPTR
jgi:phosphoserine/homoserine phosphotransferase